MPLLLGLLAADGLQLLLFLVVPQEGAARSYASFLGSACPPPLLMPGTEARSLCISAAQSEDISAPGLLCSHITVQQLPLLHLASLSPSQGLFRSTLPNLNHSSEKSYCNFNCSWKITKVTSIFLNPTVILTVITMQSLPFQRNTSFGLASRTLHTSGQQTFSVRKLGSNFRLCSFVSAAVT